MNESSSLRDIDEVTKQAVVSIPAADVTNEFEDAMERYAKSARLKGFREGKAPRHLVEKLHGKRVHLEVANRLISTSLDKIIKDAGLQVVGTPEIEISSFEAGKDIQFVANISLFPKPEIKQYDKFKVKIKKREVPSSQVDDVINNIRNSRATIRPLSGRTTVQTGDVIDAMLDVRVEGEENSRPEPLVVAVGEGRLPAELEEGLVGLEIGATKEIESVFPADHPTEEMRGKKVRYIVTLNSISERILPDLDDAFIASMEMPGIATLMELRLDITKRLEEENKRTRSAEVQQAVLEQLLNENEFLVPDILIQDEIRSLVLRNRAARDEIDSDINIDQYRPQLEEAARKRVRSAILVDRIAELAEIKPTQEDFDAHFESIAASNHIEKDVVKKFLLDKARVVSTVMEVTRTKVIETLESRASVEEE